MPRTKSYRSSIGGALVATVAQIRRTSLLQLSLTQRARIQIVSDSSLSRRLRPKADATKHIGCHERKTWKATFSLLPAVAFSSNAFAATAPKKLRNLFGTGRRDAF